MRGARRVTPPHHHNLSLRPVPPSTAVEYLSLWYNAESVANEVSSSVIERLSCTQSIVNAASAVRKAAAVRQGLPVPAKPKVLWAYNYGAWLQVAWWAIVRS